MSFSMLYSVPMAVFRFAAVYLGLSWSNLYLHLQMQSVGAQKLAKNG